MCVLRAEAILVFRGFSPSSSFRQRQEGLLEEYLQYCSSAVFLILILLELEHLPKQQVGQSLVMMVGCFLLPFAPLFSCPWPPGCSSGGSPWSPSPPTSASWPGWWGTSWTAACSCCRSSGAGWTWRKQKHTLRTIACVRVPISVWAVVEEGLDGVKVFAGVEVSTHPQVHQLEPHPRGLQYKNPESVKIKEMKCYV